MDRVLYLEKQFRAWLLSLTGRAHLRITSVGDAFFEATSQALPTKDFYKLPGICRVMRALPAVFRIFFSAMVITTAGATEFSADLETFTPPPASSQLSAEAAKRAEALALFYKGRRLEKELDDDLALAAYTKAMEIEPHNVPLASRMARLMANMGKFNEAIALLEKNLTQNGTDPVAWITISRYCLQHHHDSAEIKAKALQYAKQAVEKFPDDANVYRHLVDTYFQMKEAPESTPMERAREVLQRAAESKSVDFNFWLSLAGTARKAYPIDDKETRDANLAAIMNFADKAAQYVAENVESLEQLADFYGNYATRLKSMTLLKKALPLLEKITTIHPENLPARHKFASLLRQTGDEDRATKIYEDLVRINPQDLEAHRALIRSAEQKKDTKAIVTHRLEILRWEGGSPTDWLDLSLAMTQEKQFSEAASLLKRARLAHPRDARIPYQAAIVQHQLKRPVEALALFQETITLAEKYSDAKKNAVNVTLLKSADFYYSGAGFAAHVPTQSELAAQWYRKSLELAPKDTPQLAARCYNDLGWLWLERDEKIDEAGELIRTANEMVKDHPGYLDSLGWFHFKKKEFAEALTHLEKAEKLLKSPDPEIIDHLAQTLWELNRRPEAISKLETAIKAGNTTPALEKRLADFRAAAPAP
jgi:tetratricopeptide (TPR) repeat protein